MSPIRCSRRALLRRMIAPLYNPRVAMLVALLAGCTDTPRLTGPTAPRDPAGLRPLAAIAAATNGKLAFVSNRDGNVEIYVMNPDGSGLTRLTNNAANDALPAWSADGMRIAFVSNRDGNFEIYVMNADGSGLTRLTNNPADDNHPAWSSDGTKIAFNSDRDGNREIYVMNADGSGATRITSNPAEDALPVWSPDGTKLAFTTLRDGNREIYVMNPDGAGLTRLTNNSAFDGFPKWSPDGTKLAFDTNRDGDFEVYVMNADGSAQTNITNYAAGGDSHPAWSPDGSKIAFDSNRNFDFEVFVMNADGSGQTNLTNLNPAFDAQPAWQPLPVAPQPHPNGKIAFASTRDGNLEIYVMSPDGSGQTRLTNNPAHDWWPSWSPDGTKLAFTSQRNGNNEIYVMNANGSGATRITNNTREDERPVWSPDGMKLAFASDRDGNYEIYVMNADGSGQTRLTDNPHADIEPAWSPDGTKLAFVSSRDGIHEIYVMNADGSAQTRLTNNAADDVNPAWSPDGTKIAFASNRGGGAHEIYVMIADGSGPTRLTNNTAFDLRPAWSPDGTKLAFQSEPEGGGEIYVMNADGSGQTNLTSNPAFDAYAAWQPLPVAQPQTITFTSTPPDPAVVGGSYSLSATGGASGNPVVFSSLTPSVCTVEGSTASFVAAGSCTIAADQAGNANYEPAPQATQSFNVFDRQAITFTSTPPNPGVVGDVYTVSATGGGSGNPVVFSSLTPSVCAVSGAAVNLTASGTCTVAANQAGNANYLPAPEVTQSSDVTSRPVANAGSSQAGDEGSVVTFDASGSSDPDGDAITYTWDFGDGSPPQNVSTPTVQHTYADNRPDASAYPVMLTVTDVHGVTSAPASTSALISNVAPTGSFNPATPVGEGSFSLSLTDVRDAPGDLGTLEYAFDCGGGSGYGPFGSSASTTCSAPDNGAPRNVRAKVRDKDGASNEYAGTVSVVNVAPTVTITSAPPSAKVRTNYSLQFGFTDPGTRDSPWVFQINWGDGKKASTGVASTQGATITQTHQYTAAGTYTITVRVTDKDGGTATATAQVTVQK